MKGMMLGIIDGILGGLWGLLEDVFSGLFNTLISLLIKYIVVPVMEALFIIIKYVFATVFYGVASFLLSLIDFLEVLFRSLAGLPAIDNNQNIAFSIGGKSGDLLIQMLTSREILLAFEATAIAGIFLLIIMTIFQMIKVEYTTEGAENNKTKIMGKSLKSLTNLLLIPALCVFGVFIGNQILDLIDTATKGQSNAKISGTLFVAAASNAMYESKDITYKMTDTADLISVSVKAAFAAVGIGNFKDEFPELKTPVDKDLVETGFKAVEKGYRYGDLTEVTRYYSIFDINYLVLIFGGCMVLKSLFYVCFGMVDRLYRCVALFIVAPFVIGMTPVKDSLASWRSSFIGKAISAYGTVISINLFFIIVEIMLDISISVTGMDTIAPLLNSTLCEGLVQSIFVIVGCMMIEKLSSELGNYFGASDALGAGKSLAGEATAGLAKAASVGVGIATGGASLAMRAGKGIASGVKGAAGLAGKMKSASHDAKEKGGSGFKAAMSTGWKETGGKALKSAGKKVKDTFGLKMNRAALKDVTKQRMDKESQLEDFVEKGQTERDEKQELLDLVRKGNVAKGTKDGNRKAELMAKYGISGKGEVAKTLESQIQKYDGTKAQMEGDLKGLSTKEKGLTESVQYGEKVQAKAVLRYNALKHYGLGGVTGALPKQLTSLSSNYDKHMKEGAAGSPELEAAYEQYSSDKKDKAKGRVESDPINAAFIRQQHNEMHQILQTEASQTISDEAKKTNKELRDLNQKLNSVVSMIEQERLKGNNADQSKLNAWTNRASSLQEQMEKVSSVKIDFTGDMRAANLEEALKTAENKTKEDLKKLEDVFKANQGKSTKELLAAFEAYFKGQGKDAGGEKWMKQIMKALEDIQSRVGK